ncbi:putative repeat protein (TIGR01451 family) [Povalibacter uvarum]|uniref:Putative repeat protein (TIGR01451 family) n=1 Tax=Povalibacter uvarum TaxID=732238 RepID=A0A841HK26_9GAMM|nr:THxN family PEP-CTERM protein [Povalibacter uvarum]MBB6092375.1 putative repeat protein (TIGR01451 family) [Povalibacter uvarum]
MRSRVTISPGTKHSWIAILLVALFVLSPAERASAAEITYQSVTGIWHDPTVTDASNPGDPGYPVAVNGSPAASINWGITTGPQSGYDFIGSPPPPLQLPGPIPFFSLGSFAHRNNVVDEPWLSSVQLDVVLAISVDGTPRPPLTFTFTFNHVETPNDQTPCPFPTPPNEGCTDRVTIVASPTPTTFEVDGMEYTLSLNFLVNGQPTNEYITREGGVSNSSGLVGEFTSPPIPPGTPTLVMDKSGPPTMVPAEWGNFMLDVRNTGTVEAFNVTLLDRLPDGPTGGMCDTTPQVTSARVFAADGVTPVAGKGPLVQGTDYSLLYDSATCQLTVNAITLASVIGVGERLRIGYRTQLDDGSQYNVPLTNVAGAIQWYNAAANNPARSTYTRTLTDGTTAVVDHEDAHTVRIVPRFFADKAAALQVDSMSPGIVDAGDVLRYTIRVYNNGSLPLTMAMLRDAVPTNTTYVADSLTLNGQPVGRPDGGVSPLVAGIAVSSSDLTPPLPAAGQGTLTPGGQSAIVQFDLRVNDGVPPGTVISNQAVVDTAELPDLLTDGDGNPMTGPEPTVVVVGNLQELRITKAVSVVGGGYAIAGATLEYVVQVTNVGVVPAYAVEIRDDIAMPTPGYLSFVDQSWSMNGSTTGITVVGSLLTADYSTTYGALQPGRVITLRFRALLNSTLAIGTRVTNTGTVYWNTPQRQASATVAIDIGGMVGVAMLSGTAWHDANFNQTVDAAERLLEGWTVGLYRDDQLVHSAVTDASGNYAIGGIAPNASTNYRYELRFTAPGAGTATAALGRAHSVFTNGLQRITNIVVQSGSNYLNVNLPIEPNGVVYNTITRAPIAGATLTMLDASSQTPLPASCFDDTAQQNQVTLPYGYYRFDLNFSDPACPSGGSYIVEARAPAVGYIAGPSQIIPPASDVATGPFSVPSCPASTDDAVIATAQHCEVQASELAPPTSVRARTAGTRYHRHFTFSDAPIPVSSQVFNNHIPLDPDLQGVLQLSKTTPLFSVTRGQMIPYTITYTNVTDVPLFDVSLADRFPAGFRYVEGSARIDGTPVEPTLVGRVLTWNDLIVYGRERHSIVLLLAVGAGVSEGEFTNRAQASHALTNSPLSNEGAATVRVIPDATFDCTDVTGKVFDDANRNGIQNAGERGLSGVRLVSARGLTAITDAFGRFHITCAVVPREGRGSNFVLKLDDRTLPAGFRASTEQVKVLRATRGKALRFNFGASIHRVIGLDIADAVFEPGTANMRPQWQPRLSLLLEELQRGPAVLRLSYMADLEDKQLVDQRMAAVKKQITQSWKGISASACGEESAAGPAGACYQLTTEQEVFWRRGGPRKPAAVQELGQVNE